MNCNTSMYPFSLKLFSCWPSLFSPWARFLKFALSLLFGRSEIIQRSFKIKKALLVKADRSSFDRLCQQVCCCASILCCVFLGGYCSRVAVLINAVTNEFLQIYKLETEHKRLEEDAAVYNLLQEQLKLSPAYKTVLIQLPYNIGSRTGSHQSAAFWHLHLFLCVDAWSWCQHGAEGQPGWGSGHGLLWHLIRGVTCPRKEGFLLVSLSLSWHAAVATLVRWSLIFASTFHVGKEMAGWDLLRAKRFSES